MTPVDYVLLVFYMGLLLALGFYFRPQQRSAEDFFAGSRMVPWAVVGLSLFATLATVEPFLRTPAEAYFEGIRVVIPTLGFWLALPAALLLTLPLFRRLGITSLNEYIELRYGAKSRMLASLLAIAWRVIWAVAIFAWACHVAASLLGSDYSGMALVSIAAVAAVGYTFLGGMRAVAWTDAVQAALVIAGLAIAVVAVGSQIDGGLEHAWEAAESLGRTSFQSSSETSGPSPWFQLPYAFLLMLTLLVADQTVVQRFLSAATVTAGRIAAVVNVIVLTALAAGLALLGVCLLVLLHQQPHRIKAQWVVQSSEGNESAIQSLEESPNVGTRLQALADQGVLVDPNTGEPFAEGVRITNPTTGAPIIDRLAVRKARTGERVLLRGEDELGSYLLSDVLPESCRGLLLLAMLAAAMSSIDSVAHSSATLISFDFFFRKSTGSQILARLRGKKPADLVEADRVWLGRVFVVLVGAAIIAMGMAAFTAPLLPSAMQATSIVAGPLLGIFLLAMFVPRTSDVAGIASLAIGLVFSVALTALDAFWPQLGATIDMNLWPLLAGLIATLGFGSALCLMFGRDVPETELRGLVVGHGSLGKQDDNRHNKMDVVDPRWQ